MSVNPTHARLTRCGLLAACATLVLTPGAASAKPKDKADDKPAVCSHELPPGLAKKDGDRPPGIAKKIEGDGPPCGEPAGPAAPAPAEETPAAPQIVVNVTVPAPVVASPAAPAAVATTAASLAAPVAAPAGSCTARKAFRLRLDRKGRVRTARVKLNGRAIPVTRGKRGRASVLVDLRKRVAGTYTVRTTVVTRKGKLVTGTHRYRVCA